MSYQPHLRGRPAAPVQPRVPWPVYGEQFQMEGRTWIVTVFDDGMNLVEIDPPGFNGPPRFFIVADWKRMWSGGTQ